MLDVLKLIREARPNWIICVLIGEEGPLVAKIRSLGVIVEVLSFPLAVRSLGEGRAGLAESKRGWLSKGKRLTSWLRASSGVVVYGWKLQRRLRQLRPDLIHSNGMKMHLFGALFKPGRVPLLWYLHDYLSNRVTMKPLLQRLASRCTLVVANSQSVADDIRVALLHGPPVQAVYNPVDVSRFKPDGPRLDLDVLSGLPSALPGIVRIGLVATFAYWKGHEVFLQAAAMVSGAARFYVIGGPVYATAGSQRTLEELRSMARSLGVEEKVGFTGFVDDVPAAMRALDVVVHASTEPEPFGLVIIQAMACGRATVISAAGGAVELVEPEVSTLTHQPGNVTGLAGALERLVADPGLRTQLGVNGRRRVEEQFTASQMAARLVPLYEALARKDR